VDVGDFCHVESRWQHVDVELRIGSRPRDTSDVDETGHPVCAENLDELARRTRRVSNRVERVRDGRHCKELAALNGPRGRRTRR
jgi:hypothetical protein